MMKIETRFGGIILRKCDKSKSSRIIYFFTMKSGKYKAMALVGFRCKKLLSKETQVLGKLQIIQGLG